MGIFTFLGPLAVVLFYKNDLVMVTAVLTVGRIAACLAHAYFVFKELPGLWRKENYHPGMVRDLLVSGGWMTISNIVSPLMGYLDRFLIGALVTTAAVAYYVTPNLPIKNHNRRANKGNWTKWIIAVSLDFPTP